MFVQNTMLRAKNLFKLEKLFKRSEGYWVWNVMAKQTSHFLSGNDLKKKKKETEYIEQELDWHITYIWY